MTPLQRKTSVTLGRAAIAAGSCLVAYKLAVALLPDPMGRAFDGFTPKMWLRWVLDPQELLFVGTAASACYIISVAFLRHCGTVRLIIWGGLTGAYVALLIVHDVISRIDAISEYVLPAQRYTGRLVNIGIALVCLMALVVAPLIVAWLLCRVGGQRVEG